MIGDILTFGRVMLDRRLPEGRLDALRARRLRAVVRHAGANVPYYRELFRSAGLKPETIRTPDDLHRIPVSTREDVAAAGTDLLAEGTSLATCRRMDTSGSTGRPLAVHLSPEDWRARRMVEFHMLLAAGFRPTDRLAVIGPSRPHRERLHQRLGLYRSTNISPLLGMEEICRRLRRMDPTIVWFYPSVLRALLNHFAGPLGDLVRPRALVYCAEVLDASLRERIRGELDLPIFNFYGCVEAGMIAAECRAHRGLHVNQDHVILECLDREGRPAGPGQRGVVVVTTLNTRTMPFIRYRVGDLFSFADRGCRCGSRFPLIEPPRGREDDMPRLPSGRELSPFAFSMLLRHVPGLRQFRVIQHRLDHFEVLLVFRDGEGESQLPEIRRSLLQGIAEPVRLDIRLVPSIEEERSKFRLFVSRLRS